MTEERITKKYILNKNKMEQKRKAKDNVDKQYERRSKEICQEKNVKQ